MYVHTRSIAHKISDIWRSPGRFTKNPDMVRLPSADESSGRLLLVYSDTDQHWSQVNQVLTLLESTDDGVTWRKATEIDSAELAKGDERLVTPRLSLLDDGRLAVIVDHDDHGNFHEDQPYGNWIYFSEDEGKSWSGPHTNEISGFEPDRMMDLPDGTLGVASHVMRGDTQEFAEILSVSEDGGTTWYERATIAHDGYHRFCEGAIVILDGGAELACIMRENHSAGIPCFAAFSRDNGWSWSQPVRMPFALHRPYAKQIADGRVLVTGRHVNGGLGTYGWCGDLHRDAGYYALGAPRREHEVRLEGGELVITNRPDHEARYTLLPPENATSIIELTAELSVSGPEDESVAFLSLSRLNSRSGGLVVHIAPNWISLNDLGAEFRKAVDMTKPRTLTLRHRRGLFEAFVDGKQLLRGCVFRESPPNSDFRGGDPRRRTQFGQLGEAGESRWRRVHYAVQNPTQPAFSWRWSSAENEYPDQYQRDRMIQIHPNDPDQRPNPDHGYSSWLPLPDGRIVFVDYTNRGDEPGKSHLVGGFIDPEDLA